MSQMVSFILQVSCNLLWLKSIPFFIPAEESKYDFDAFISFAEEDKTFAEEGVKRQLEELGYSICWHHDAFIPGFTVNENMEMFIFRSNYTIALISRAFFMSNFCTNELEITRRKIQNTGHNCLIPIMVEKWDEIPSELLKITYIDIDDKMLIQRLKRILGECTSLTVTNIIFCRFTNFRNT